MFKMSHLTFESLFIIKMNVCGESDNSWNKQIKKKQKKHNNQQICMHEPKVAPAVVNECENLIPSSTDSHVDTRNSQFKGIACASVPPQTVLSE